MLLIFSPEISPRLQYTTDLIFGQLLGISFRITHFKEEILHYEGPTLAYCFHPVEAHFSIPASGLLFERNIASQQTRLDKTELWEEMPVPFVNQNPDPGFDLPFDLFSAVFYLVSRYEEYLPFEPDEHHRFHSGESWAFHNGVLDRPLVNEWIIGFANMLKEKMKPGPDIHLPSYRFLPTVDVDNAFAYKHKGWRRTLGGYLQDIQSMEDRNHRYQVLLGHQQDPYDTFDLMHRFHREHELRPVWFFLLGNYGPYDKNISYRKRAYQKLIGEIADDHPVGIHPSYGSDSSPERIRQEINRLHPIIKKPIEKSRQHYLKLDYPRTYRALSHLGIREDYSLGYGERLGFRASIATPIPFFDLEENRTLDLIIYPFQVMDITLQQFLNLTPDEALERVKQIIDTIRRVGGTFSTLWHNESLSEWKQWTGWSEVYRNILEAAAE